MVFFALITAALAGSPVQDALTRHRQLSANPFPMPSAAQVAQLEAGELLKVRLPGQPGAPDGAMVLAVLPLSKEALWLGSADSHGEEDRLIAHHLPLTGDEMFRWYGLLDLPRPFSDRHFCIRTVINTAMSTAEPGMWERTWTLAPDGKATVRAVVERGAIEGITTERFDDAVYTPSNSGGWLMLELSDGRTLFGYHAVTSLGGDIPDNLVSRYAFWGLDEIARTVFERARAIEQHYTGDHPVIRGGDGQPLPRY